MAFFLKKIEACYTIIQNKIIINILVTEISYFSIVINIFTIIRHTECLVKLISRNPTLFCPQMTTVTYDF